MKPFHEVRHRFANGLGITQPLDTKKQSTKVFLGGLLLVLVLCGLAI